MVNSKKDWGISHNDLSYDWEAIMKKKESTTVGLTRGIEGLFKKNKVTYYKGYGKVTGPKSVLCTATDGTETNIESKNIIIATGSEVTPFPGIAIDEKVFISSTGA